ncbi:MAG: F0F1 ATP synthase subunit B [Acidimicrobiia bacterium]
MRSSQLIVAQEEGGGLDLLLPAVPELIAGIVAFSIVFFFVWRFAAPALNRLLEQRQAAISGQIAEAEKAKSEAESLRRDYQTQLDQAKAEANRIIDEARDRAEQISADIVSRAEAEAEQIREKAREEASAERARALAEARTQVGNISVDLAEKILGESLDSESHQSLIDRYLADLERL